MQQALTTQTRLAQHGDRVRDHSAAKVNREIDRKMRFSIEEAIRQGRDAVVRRITFLDGEWDIDRALMVTFAAVGAATFGIGLKRFARPRLFRRRRTGALYLFGAQLGWMMVHGLVGWCPPVPLFRRLGVRTKAEIETEKSVLLRVLEARRQASMPASMPTSASSSTPQGLAPHPDRSPPSKL